MTEPVVEVEVEVGVLLLVLVPGLLPLLGWAAVAETAQVLAVLLVGAVEVLVEVDLLLVVRLLGAVEVLVFGVLDLLRAADLLLVGVGFLVAVVEHGWRDV